MSKLSRFRDTFDRRLFKAGEGPDVTTLLIELARLHGISEAAERSNHGIDSDPSELRDPVQGKRPDRV